MHRAKQVKSPTEGVPEVVKSTPQSATEKSSTTSPTPGPTDICRVQVRLPNGRVIRHNFPASASLDDVITFVMEKEPHFSNVVLVQVCVHVCVCDYHKK